MKKPLAQRPSHALETFMTDQEEQYAYKAVLEGPLSNLSSDYQNQYEFIQVQLQSTKQKHMLDRKHKPVPLGFDHQCKRYPKFKDVKKLWHFDYAAEEKKRFKDKPPELMWDPSATQMTDQQINDYIHKA